MSRGPGREERETLDAWLDAALGAGRPRAARRVTLRRLNRTEYNNTIRDLIGLDLHPADDFPADDVGYGFDNIGDVLATPPILVEMHAGRRRGRDRCRVPHRPRPGVGS